MAISQQDAQGYVGTRDDESDTSDFNAHSFLVKQLIGRISTATMVQVMAVTNTGGVSPVGFVDVKPLVKLIDGLGNTTPHGTIYHLSYSRIQGGANAVILDPQVGDIGACIFADHDLSTVKATGKEAPPGSRRRFDMADGIYLFCVVGAAPTQYVQFSAAGIKLLSPTKITLEAPLIDVIGPMHGSSAIIAGYGGADQVGLQTHVHTQGNDGHGDSEVPTNAPTAGT